MTKTVLNVVGMSCGSCVGHVTRALALEGIVKVDVRLDAKEVAIEHVSGLSSESMIAALARAGFSASPQVGRVEHV